MAWQKALFYFMVGGSVLCVVTYLGSRHEGFWASFVAVLPVITATTFVTVHREGGAPAIATYAKGLILLQPAWLSYVAIVVYLTPRRGLPAALAIGVSVYVAGALLIKRLAAL